MSADPREDIALLRFRIIGEAVNPRLTPAERGHLVRELANQAHQHPDGSEWTYSRVTLDRWIRAYREHGLDGLRPPPRADLGIVRRHPELLEEACQLRLELPGRSAAQIAAILKARRGISVPERTIREHLHRRGLHRAALAGQPRAFGRFEAERPNERWMGDVLVGPFVPFPRVAGSKRAYLFLLVDDFSRLLVHSCWVTDQNTRAGQDLLREAFRWSVMRRVTTTASVSLAGNRYAVDEALVGRRVELRFDPEDLTRLDVYWEGHPAGQAIPFILGRHVHRQVPQAQPPTPPAPTGVDYLGLVLAAHDAETLGQLAFRDLPMPQPRNGQTEDYQVD